MDGLVFSLYRKLLGSNEKAKALGKYPRAKETQTRPIRRRNQHQARQDQKDLHLGNSPNREAPR